ncbi:MAG TPA: sigma-54 dependent transcriptional regulator [Acetobacteraceae bacterium]|nr:sigma-54 dependent transcriptional regulator [Acetobacteraceae bacterium]
MSTILVVDDDAALTEALAETVADLGHRPLLAAGGEAALALAASAAPDAVLLDLRMPDLDGIAVLRRLRASPAPAPVAILTAHATAANTIDAMRLGAFDHLTKPIGRDALADLLARMLRARPPAAPALEQATDEDAFIGASAAMREVQKTIGRVADTDATVLVTGETGTGKEVVARAIHRHGRRAAGAFVAVNCAAIPAELLESTLFGHVRGAFTGAVADRAGAFHEAAGGTLLLDEIGDMDTAMQAKILRILQERVVTPVGGRAAAVDVRIVAATHRDLPARVREGRFREDLFYRLSVVPVALPALRERPGDVALLAAHFLRPLGRRLGPDAAARLAAHPWPGNVRELRNALQRAAVLASGEELRADDFDFLDAAPDTAPDAAPDGAAVAPDDLPAAVARLEARMIASALHEAGGNRAAAARRLGIHRQLLYAKARRYGLTVQPAEEVGEPDDAA